MEKFDKETEKWFRQHPYSQTTVMTCEKCGLIYKPSLGHKCKAIKSKELTKGTKVFVKDNSGKEWEGKIANISDYREPNMKYAVDLGFDDYVFVGEERIRVCEKEGKSNGE